MMALQHFSLITMCLLIIQVTADEKYVEFDYEFRYIVTKTPVNILNIPNKTYTGRLDYQQYTFYNNPVFTKNQVERSTAVKCQHFISYSGQEDIGIYTCQDEDNKHFAIPLGDVKQNHIPEYPICKIACEEFVDIIEGKQVTSNCTLKNCDNLSNTHEITIGWIQGKHNITDSYNLDSNTRTQNLNLTFKGYQSGDGIFFYCISEYAVANKYTNRCYTLTLPVYPKLNLKMMTIHGNREHCFKCLATGGSGPKDYQWTSDVLSETGYNGENDDERCFNNLTTGEYTVKCLVTTAAQNKSGEIKFTVADVVPTDTTKQTSPLTTQISKSKVTDNSDNDVIIIILIVTICLLLLVVMLSLYVILRRNYSKHPKRKRSHQDIIKTSNSRQRSKSTDNESTIANRVEVITNASTEYQELQFKKSLDAEDYLKPMDIYMHLKM